MPLNWNIEKVKDHHDLWEVLDDQERRPHYGEVTRIREDGVHTRLNPITSSLTLRSIVLGLGEITERNVDEWTYRSALLDRVHGSSLTRGDEPVLITRADIERHVGLYTNVATERRASFEKRILDGLKSNVKGGYDKQVLIPAYVAKRLFKRATCRVCGETLHAIADTWVSIEHGRQCAEGDAGDSHVIAEDAEAVGASA